MLKSTTTIRVKYADTDQMGVAYHGRFFEWFEAGRTELLRECGLPYTVIESRGLHLPVVEATARYYRPAHYDDILTILTRLEALPRVTITLDYEIFDESRTTLLVTGRTVHSFVRTSGKPTRAPAWALEAFRHGWSDV